MRGTRAGEPSAGRCARDAYGLGATLAWTLLDLGHLRAQVAAAGALEETEGALATFTRSQRETDALRGAALAADQAAELARARFGAGRSDFLAVLDAEREQLAARERLVLASTGSATARVVVYRALAGGW